MTSGEEGCAKIPPVFLLACLSAVIFLETGCGSGSGSTPSPPPSPITLTPTLLWPEEPQVTNSIGDNGITATGQPPGVSVMPDGSGGALLTFEDDWHGFVFAQRLDSNGNRMWSDTGVRLAPDSPFQTGPVAISDGATGMIIAFVDGRAGFCDYSFRGSCQVYAQRVDSTGMTLWQADGIPIDTATGNQGDTGISIVSDGAGGAFLAWQDARACCAIYAQHITASGQILWTTDGVAVSPPPTLAVGAITPPPIIVPDDSGGALVAWWNLQVPSGQNPFLSTQRLDPQGHLLWPAGGAPVSLHLLNPSDSGLLYFSMVPDGAGGAIIAAVDNHPNSSPSRVVMVQRVSPDGQNLWASNGVPVTTTTTPQTTPTLLQDGAGGAFVSWRNCDPNGYQNCDIFAQRLDSSGQSRWGVQGISISSAPGVQIAQQIVSDANGGVIITWNDCRNYAYPSQINTCYSQMDIYGQRVNSLGKTLWQADGFPITKATGNQGTPYTVEFIFPSYALSPDGHGGVLLAWPDGRDGPCFSSIPGPGTSLCELRSQHVQP